MTKMMDNEKKASSHSVKLSFKAGSFCLAHCLCQNLYKYFRIVLLSVSK